MQTPLRYAAAGSVLAALLVGVGPARAEPPTWHDLFPGLPRDLPAQAGGPVVTDGRHLPGTVPPGVYMAPAGHCRFTFELTREARQANRITLSADSSGPEPRGPKHIIVHEEGEDGIIAAYVLSGGCEWRRVGSVEDARRWFSEYAGS
ncbi:MULTISPECIES: hypothetical protein [unclassified Nonomuraea]|uniref:hypothetical protein n=1 Tax=unclassified Nonomuraea TaxID=2593643 RepID=UPI0035BEF217